MTDTESLKCAKANEQLDAADELARLAEAFKRELEEECVKSGNRTLDPLHGEAKVYNDANYKWSHIFARLFEKVEPALTKYRELRG
jgi:hypothetical protein